MSLWVVNNSVFQETGPPVFIQQWESLCALAWLTEPFHFFLMGEIIRSQHKQKMGSFNGTDPAWCEAITTNSHS